MSSEALTSVWKVVLSVGMFALAQEPILKMKIILFFIKIRENMVLTVLVKFVQMA